ncbi:MAG: S8 family serine peptidase [Candidatus Methanofastidiosia archaeon]
MRYKNSQRIVGVLKVFIFLVFLGSFAKSSTEEPFLIVVIFAHAEDVQTIPLNISILEVYENFVLAKVTQNQYSLLLQMGFEIDPLLNRTLVNVNRFTFDTTEGEPEIPSNLKIAEYSPGEEGYYIVQFYGPIKDQWLETLESLGGELIGYIPNFAYLVRMQTDVKEAIEDFSFVEWIGIYHPAYKLSKTLEGKTDTIQVILEINDVGNTEETINRIEEMGGIIIDRFQGKTSLFQFTYVIFLIDASKTVEISTLEDVLLLEYFIKDEIRDEVSDQIIVGNYTGGIPFTGYNAFLTGKGVDGTGVTVSIADTGIDTNVNATLHQDMRGRLVAFIDYSGGTNLTDANGHGTHVAGIVAGNATLGTTDGNGFFYGLGVAPNTNLISQNYCDSTGLCGYTIYSTLTRDAILNGAEIINNSWGGSPGAGYTSSSALWDSLVRDGDSTTPAIEPLIAVFSAGNDGPGSYSIDHPIEAKNIIHVGASENYRLGLSASVSCGTVNADNIDDIPCFSSRGPAIDGRYLPDVVAPGAWIASAQSYSAPLGGLWGSITADYQWCSGTSQAAPHTSGAAALIVQWWRATQGGATPSPAITKALLINGAVDMGTPDIPNNNEGWGRIDLNNVINNGEAMVYYDQTNTFSQSGEQFQVQVTVPNTSSPLKVSLIWSDAPASAGASPALVNDLDLEVSDGINTYYGNVFSSGWSVTGGSYDRLNNVENVYLQSPSGALIYTITVRGFNISGDGVPGNADTTDQDFALVLYNASQTLTTSSITSFTDSTGVDVSTYIIGVDQIYVTVTDGDENTNPASQEMIQATISDGATGDSESLTLNETGVNTGIFRNTTGLTSSSNPVGNPSNNILETQSGNTIQVGYTDDDHPADTSSDTAIMITAAAGGPSVPTISAPAPSRVICRISELMKAESLKKEVDSLEKEAREKGYNLNKCLVNYYKAYYLLQEARILSDHGYCERAREKALDAFEIFQEIKKCLDMLGVSGSDQGGEEIANSNLLEEEVSKTPDEPLKENISSTSEEEIREVGEINSKEFKRTGFFKVMLFSLLAGFTLTLGDMILKLNSKWR